MDMGIFDTMCVADADGRLMYNQQFSEGKHPNARNVRINTINPQKMRILSEGYSHIGKSWRKWREMPLDLDDFAVNAARAVPFR